jgi:predicted kinase
LLVVVSGPPGSGKTTLSRRLGDAVGLPVVCRDGVKEGVAVTTGELVRQGTPEAVALFDLFYDLVDAHLTRGVSAIAEAAFQGAIADRELAGRRDVAEVRHVRCDVAPEVWLARFEARGRRPGHRDHDFLDRVRRAGGPDSSPYRLTIPGVPVLDVDTTDGYRPGLEEIARFAVDRSG